MPNIKSAIKRVAVAERNRQRNRYWKSTVRTSSRELEDYLKSADLKALDKSLSEVYQVIDKAVTKGAIHPNAAARRKSKLAKQVLVLKGASPTTAKPAKSAKSAKTTKSAKSK